MKLRNLRISDFLGARNSFRQIVDYERLLRNKFRYVFRAVGTSRCDVRAACSGATPSNGSDARIFVPPASTRAGTAQRAIPTSAPKAYKFRAPICPCERPSRTNSVGRTLALTPANFPGER